VTSSKALILKPLLALAVILAGAGPLSAGTRKGDKFMAQGTDAEVRKEYDKALEFYEKALETDPGDVAYLLAVQRVRFQASQKHVDNGRDLREQGKLDEALAEFQKGFAIDPSSAIAESEMRRTSQLIERAARMKESGTELKPEELGILPAEAARREAEVRVGSILGVPELKPISSQVTNLRMANQPPKVLFETIGKLAGINVLFDSEYTGQDKRFSLDLTRATLEEALDDVALLTKSFWKPLNENTIFVANDNATKRRDLEDHVTKVFYFQNVTSPQELQEAMTAIRTVTDVRKIFPYNSQSALVIRGTADQIALAEKVMLDLDKPKSEVVVDVLVLEASRSKNKELTAAIESGGSPGLGTTITSTPNGVAGSSTSSSTGVYLSKIGSLGGKDWTATIPGAQLTAFISNGTARVLQAPEVRATDGQKASLRLGDRYPYATGSFQPGVGAVGVSPLVSTQFQFADVGVNVDITPRIHGADEVSMQIDLEISNIKETVTLGGLQQPVIGQRKVSHIIRVKEGEVTLIGGLMQANEKRTRAGIPGLMSIPGLGRLFSSDVYSYNDDDLLVALIPHIVRSPQITPENLKAIATGTEQVYRVSYAPKPEAAKPEPAKPEQPKPEPSKPAPVPAAPATPPAAQPAPTIPSADAPATPPPPPATGVTAAFPPLARVEPGAAAQAQLLFVPSTTEAALHSQVTVSVNARNMTSLFSAPMKIAFDNKVLKLVEIRNGGFMSSDGQKVVFNPVILPDAGGAIISLNRVPGSGGVTGSGTLVTLVFQTVGPGSSPVTFNEVTLRDDKLQSIQVTPPSVAITVK
jgi:general secretion pathway protein D